MSKITSAKANVKGWLRRADAWLWRRLERVANWVLRRSFEHTRPTEVRKAHSEAYKKATIVR